MIPKTKKLFISYRSSDAAKVDKIAKDLSLLVYDDGTPRHITWQDKHNLPPASPHWWDAIVDAIIDCHIFVFFLSKESLLSDVCRAELDYAYKRNRPIITVVLDDESFLRADADKYDLPKETWELVPDWLGNSQFIFYINAKFYGQFQQAIHEFERNWPPDFDARRPLNPDDKSVHGSNHALYDAACDYAGRMAFADAEKHFRALVRRNDVDYSDVAIQWLEIIERYTELIEIDTRRNARFIFKSRWETYLALFPKIFLDGIFDPKNFKGRNGDVVTSSPPAKPTSLSLLPAPFDWIEIPGGHGTMKRDKSGVTLPIPIEKYWISKYPITNAQFAKFIEAGGYREKRWWTEAGWEAREEAKWTAPHYWTDSKWRDSKWNGAEQPMVGVLWYEAVAFCLWLSDVTGENIMLPTEAQWQYAAQGDDGRAYPWGNDWDASRCNNNVDQKGIGKTTSVRQYEDKGNSPFGVVDMAGNVWEWCLTDYHSQTNDINGNDRDRVLRGGSWDSLNTNYVRCDYRSRPNLLNSLGGRGFRVSRS